MKRWFPRFKNNNNNKKIISIWIIGENIRSDTKLFGL